MKEPKIKVIRLEKDLVKAIRLIDKLLSKNDFNFKYLLNLDYKMKDFGQFDPQEANSIYINPAAFYDTKKELPHAKYFTTDFSIFAVSIHEFSHLLDAKLNILDKYKVKFPERLILNDNSQTDRREELAEIMSLYILNPYMLRLIDKPRYNFMRTIFLSPTPCLKTDFIVKWNRWSDRIRELCFRRWGFKVSGGKIIVQS